MPFPQLCIITIQPEAISFLHIPDDCKSYSEAKEKYGSKVTLIGCVPPPWIMSASPEEVYEECKNEIDIFRKNGGYILATGCEYPANASFENAEVMVRAAKEYGKY
jgi:uroporphyrinogen decarboxylase